MRAALVPSALLLLALTAPLPVHADSTEANCEVRKHGDKLKDASGPCTFSQRQGYIDIKLKNGDAYSLSPTSKTNHFKDQDGNKVERTKTDGDMHKYEWEHRKIIVTFGGGSSGGGERRTRGGSLEDLVDMKARDGEQELEGRGYRLTGTSKSEDRIYGQWWNAESKHCVTVATRDGRYAAITDTTPSDCGKDVGGADEGRGHERSAEPAKFEDLVGARASSGESELESRGFRHVDTIQSGDNVYTIWFNPRTHQCLQVDTVDGKYYSVNAIQEHPKCQ